jgi:hypothetical protein
MSDHLKVNPDGWVTGSLAGTEDYVAAFVAFKAAEGMPDDVRIRRAVDAVWQRAVAEGRRLVAIEAEHA